MILSDLLNRLSDLSDAKLHGSVSTRVAKGFWKHIFKISDIK